MQASPLQLPDGLSIRPARDNDKAFVESLFKSTRDDLRLIDAEHDYIENLIEQQHHAQTVGYGEQFPNAMYFIIEKQNERIGRVVIDFGANEVRIVDIAFIPVARNNGYGASIIRALKHTAAQVCAPMVLSVSRMNLRAKSFYLSEGFQVEESDDAIELMAWYPQQMSRSFHLITN